MRGAAVAAGDITQNKGVLEARNERAETSAAITSVTGPNASVSATTAEGTSRLLAVLDEAFRPEREEEEEEEGRKERRRREETLRRTSRRLQCFPKTDHR